MKRLIQVFSTFIMGICVSIIFSGNAYAQHPALPYHPNTIQPALFPVPATPFEYNDWITNVTFAGINNSTNNVLWRNTYSGLTPGKVVRGQSYTISVSVNATGADFSFQYIAAFIDWNRNGDCGGKFPEHGGSGRIDGECYVLGSGAGHANPLTLNITIPNDAEIGTTWLRVTLKADGLPVADDYLSYFGFGEIEEYPITVYAAAPSTQASSILLPSNGAGTQLNVSWTNGNGTSRAVFMKEGSGAITNPSNNTTYTASANWSSKGSQLGSSGYYCIYNGTGNSVAVTNISPNTQYTIRVYEYTNSAGNEQYNTATASGNPSSETSLPVTLASFTASTMGKNVILNWRTVTEVSNYGFEVERSADQINWDRIGFVKGHGNSNSEHNYSYSDDISFNGVLYYRLKQLDSDGHFEYSKEISVNNSHPTMFSVDQNFPNPFNPSTTIRFSIASRSNVKVDFYASTGELVHSLATKTYEVGNHTISFDASQLSAGTYLCRISGIDADGQSLSAVKKMQLIK